MPHSLFFKGALQGVTSFGRSVHDLGHFRFGNLERIHPANTDALLVYMQHDGIRVFPVLAEKLLKNHHNKFHWRIVVVQQKHLVQRRFLRFRFHAGENAGIRMVVVLVW
jgi:hypothetical protein